LNSSKLDKCQHEGGSCERPVVIVMRYVFSKNLTGVCAEHALLYESFNMAGRIEWYEKLTYEEALVYEVIES
jgi:hypothetical protein